MREEGERDECKTSKTVWVKLFDLLVFRTSPNNIFQIHSGYMWQSRVEIEHYSVAYFDRVTGFKAL